MLFFCTWHYFSFVQMLKTFLYNQESVSTNAPVCVCVWDSNHCPFVLVFVCSLNPSVHFCIVLFIWQCWSKTSRSVILQSFIPFVFATLKQGPLRAMDRTRFRWTRQQSGALRGLKACWTRVQTTYYRSLITVLRNIYDCLYSKSTQLYIFIYIFSTQQCNSGAPNPVHYVSLCYSYLLSDWGSPRNKGTIRLLWVMCYTIC